MNSKTAWSLVFSSLLCLPRIVLAADSLTPANPVELVGTQGKFDFIKVDSANNRLLACHTGNGSLDVIDVIKSNLLKSIPTGNAQGVAIDSKNREQTAEDGYRRFDEARGDRRGDSSRPS
jgi:hypothetical protein